MMRPGLLFALSGFVLVSCLLMGGNTHSGFLSDVVLQLVSIPLLLVAIWNLPRPADGRGSWAMLAMCCLVAALPIVQLIPLSPLVWSRLPGREPIVAAFVAMHRDLPWMPLSMTPRQTWLSALSLLPPLALLLAMMQLGYSERRQLALLVIGVGLVSAMLGLVQVAQGPTSALRFFHLSSSNEAVGFFANRNHFSALLYCMTVLVAAWAVEATAPPLSMPRIKIWETALIVPIVASFVILVVLVAAQAMARSRAGLGLTILALFGGLAIGLADRRNTSGVTSAKLVAGATALAVIFTLQLAMYRVLDRFSGDPLDDARIQFAQRTWVAVKAHMPFGAGLGSFVQVYPLFERPQDTLVDTFANRAHNDAIEFLLEAGAPGFVLLVLFLLWLGWRSVRVWRGSPPAAGSLDRALARAATVILVLLLAHSLVDYPLRTQAMMGVAAFALALLVPPPRNESDDQISLDADTKVDQRPRRTSAPRAAADRGTPPVREPDAPIAWPHQPMSPPATEGGSNQQRQPLEDWPSEWLKEPVPKPAEPFSPPPDWGGPVRKP